MCVGVVVYVGVCRGSSACEVIVGVCIRVVVVYVGRCWVVVHVK